MIPTAERCYDGGKHNWGDKDHGDAWCKKCGCRSLLGMYLGPDDESMLGRPGVAFDIDIPTCHKQREGSNDISTKPPTDKGETE